MAMRTHLRKTLLFALSTGLLILFSTCEYPNPEPLLPPPSGKLLPSSVEVETDMQTATYTFYNDNQGKIEKIEDDQGFEMPVTYSGDLVIGISDIYSAKYNSESQPIETLLDIGSYKNRTDWSYTNGQLSAITSYNLEEQSDGSFSENMAAEISNINFGSKNQGSFTYKTRFFSYDGTFSWNDMENTLQDWAPYFMMFEFTDQFYMFTNVGHNRCITNVELTDQADSSKIMYGVEYEFDEDGNITERELSIDQSGFANTIRHIFYF